MAANNKRKILLHICCAPCASYVLSELEKENFVVTGFFYNPEVHGRAEYKRRLDDALQLFTEKGVELIVPEYDMQEFLAPLMPYQDIHSIKYISDKKRYRRKRCQFCVSNIIQRTILQTKELKYKYFSTTMLCSPYRDHDEIWDKSLELATQQKLNFFYKDFRKGYWTGRNYARSHNLMIPRYCGCADSLDEGRLE